MSYGNEVETFTLDAIYDRIRKSSNHQTTKTICDWRSRFWMGVCKRDCSLHLGSELHAQTRKLPVVKKRRSFEFGARLGMELRLVHESLR